MNSSRHLLLALSILAVQAGLTAAQMPAASLPAGNGYPAALSPTDMGCPTDCGTSCCAGRTGLVGGAGFYLIQPYFENNPAYNVLVQSYRPGPPPPPGPRVPTAITTGIGVDRVNVSHSMAIAPLVWLGYIGDDGFGGRARYWTFRQGTSQSISLPPFTGQYEIYTPLLGGHPVIELMTGTQSTITTATPLGLQAFGDTISIQHGPEATTVAVTTELYVQVADLEAMQTFQLDQYYFLASGGVRLARLNQTYNAYDAQSAAGLRSLLSSYNFAGAGPTVSLEMWRALGTSGFALYGSGRGSLVFGSAQQNALFSGQELRNDDPNPQFATQRRDRALPIAEMEAGIQYGRAVGRSWFFTQVGLVGQEWFSAGNASRSTQLTPKNSPNPAEGGASIDTDLAFFGLSFRIGVNY